MTEDEREIYLWLLALACSSWHNPPKWESQYEREQAEREWFEFLRSVVPANLYLGIQK